MQAVLQVVDKLPTISTQLKIIAAVKATRQGGDGKLMMVHRHMPYPYTRTFKEVFEMLNLSFSQTTTVFIGVGMGGGGGGGGGSGVSSFP